MLERIKLNWELARERLVENQAVADKIHRWGKIDKGLFAIDRDREVIRGIGEIAEGIIIPVSLGYYDDLNVLDQPRYGTRVLARALSERGETIVDYERNFMGLSRVGLNGAEYNFYLSSESGLVDQKTPWLLNHSTVMSAAGLTFIPDIYLPSVATRGLLIGERESSEKAWDISALVLPDRQNPPEEMDSYRLIDPNLTDIRGFLPKEIGKMPIAVLFEMQ